MDILDKFLENAKETIAEGYYTVESNNVKRFPRASLKELLSKKEFSLIAEIKHASPTGEYSFGNINAKKASFEFMKAGADAISVVVEPRIFKGNLLNVTDAKASGLPVLFKDFIIDKKQIKAASELGADAVLLIVKAADRTGFELDELISFAHELSLEVLLEAYNDAELTDALKTDADIIGINNRDLTTLKVNLGTTEKILESFKGKIDRPLISESGIKNAQDATRIKSSGANGVLVGTSIWTSPDKAAKIRELKGYI